MCSQIEEPPPESKTAQSDEGRVSVSGTQAQITSDIPTTHKHGSASSMEQAGLSSQAQRQSAPVYTTGGDKRIPTAYRHNKIYHYPIGIVTNWDFFQAYCGRTSGQRLTLGGFGLHFKVLKWPIN